MTPEKKLAKIAHIFETTRKIGKNTVSSTHAYYNLEGAIIDLERTGKADRVILETLKRVRKQLGDIGKVIEE